MANARKSLRPGAVGWGIQDAKVFLHTLGQKEPVSCVQDQGRFSDRVKLWWWLSDSLALAPEGAPSVCYDLRPDAKPGGYDEEIDLHTDVLIIKRGGKANCVRADAGLKVDVQIFVTKQ